MAPDENSIKSWVVTCAIARRWKEKARGTLRQLGKLKGIRYNCTETCSKRLCVILVRLEPQ